MDLQSPTPVPSIIRLDLITLTADRLKFIRAGVGLRLNRTVMGKRLPDPRDSYMRLGSYAYASFRFLACLERWAPCLLRIFFGGEWISSVRDACLRLRDYA